VCHHVNESRKRAYFFLTRRAMRGLFQTFGKLGRPGWHP
jgi:hypothetical protein